MYVCLGIINTLRYGSYSIVIRKTTGTSVGASSSAQYINTYQQQKKNYECNSVVKPGPPYYHFARASAPPSRIQRRFFWFWFFWFITGFIKVNTCTKILHLKPIRSHSRFKNTKKLASEATFLVNQTLEKNCFIILKVQTLDWYRPRKSRLWSELFFISNTGTGTPVGAKIIAWYKIIARFF